MSLRRRERRPESCPSIVRSSLGRVPLGSPIGIRGLRLTGSFSVLGRVSGERNPMNRSTPVSLHTPQRQLPLRTPQARCAQRPVAQLRPAILAALRPLVDAFFAWQRKAFGFHRFGDPRVKVGRTVILTALLVQRRRFAIALLSLLCTLPLAACATNERESYLGARRTIISSAQGDASQRVSRLDQRATVARAEATQQ